MSPSHFVPKLRLASAVSALVVVCATVLLSPPLDAAQPATAPTTLPSFQGRTVLQWARDCQLSSSQQSRTASAAVRAIGPDAIPTLVDSLKHGADWWTRASAALALSDLGAAAAPAVRALALSLDDPDLGVRQYAAIAIGRIHADPDIGVPALMRQLNRGQSVNYYAASALGDYGTVAVPAVPDLIRLLSSDQDSTRRCAAAGLRGIGAASRDAVPKLSGLVRDQIRHAESDPDFVDALAGIGEPGLPMLVEVLQAREADQTLRFYTFRAVGRMGIHAGTAIPVLNELLRSDNPFERTQSILTLPKIGIAADAAVPELLRIAKSDSDSETSNRAAWAAYQIDPAASKKAGVPRPATGCEAMIQLDSESYDDNEPYVTSGPAIDPLVVWLNGDPIGIYNGGGEMLSLNPWLRPGANRFTLTGVHPKPVYVMIDPKTVDSFGESLGRSVFEPIAEAQTAPVIRFDAPQAIRLPERESLAGIPNAELEKQADALLDKIETDVREHRGQAAVDLLYQGPLLYSAAASGDSLSELKEHAADSAKALSQPDARLQIGSHRLIVGDHLLLVLANGQPGPDHRLPQLVDIHVGDQRGQLAWLQLAKVDGCLIVWAVPRNSFSISINGSSVGRE
jgi:HEAT repeat protein